MEGFGKAAPGFVTHGGRSGAGSWNSEAAGLTLPLRGKGPSGGGCGRLISAAVQCRRVLTSCLLDWETYTSIEERAKRGGARHRNWRLCIVLHAGQRRATHSWLGSGMLKNPFPAGSKTQSLGHTLLHLQGSCNLSRTSREGLGSRSKSHGPPHLQCPSRSEIPGGPFIPTLWAHDSLAGL